MIFEKYIPRLPLASYVESIIYIEGNNKGAGFPKTNMSLVFNLNDSFKLYKDDGFSDYTRYNKHWLAGHQTSPKYVESYGQSKMVVVQFKTLGAYPFLKEPLHYFIDDFITLDCIFHHDADDTWEQLQEAKTIKEKMLLTENFLYRKLLIQDHRHLGALGAINILLDERPSPNITKICKEFGISRKHLNNLFKEKVGLSPKLLSSLYRLQTTFKSLSQGKPEKLTNFAYEQQYFDQAHFSNDFKKFTSLTPLEYLKKVDVTPSLKVVPHFLPYT